MKMKREYVITVQGALAAVGTFLSAKLGILYPVLYILVSTMVLDYIAEMLASKNEVMDHPDDVSYGWNSREGAKGIVKKMGYLYVVAAAMVVDYVIVLVSVELGMQISVKTFFRLLVAVWYLLSKLLSIVKSAGRINANVPEWLRKYIAVLKDKIDNTDYQRGSRT